MLSRLLADRQHAWQHLHRRLTRDEAQAFAQFDRASGDAVQQRGGARIVPRPAARIDGGAAAGAKPFAQSADFGPLCTRKDHPERIEQHELCVLLHRRRDIAPCRRCDECRQPSICRATGSLPACRIAGVTVRLVVRAGTIHDLLKGGAEPVALPRRPRRLRNRVGPTADLRGVIGAGALRSATKGLLADIRLDDARMDRVHADPIGFARELQGRRFGEQRYAALVIELSGSSWEPTIPAIEARLTIALPCSPAFAASRNAGTASSSPRNTPVIFTATSLFHSSRRISSSPCR